ncbi:MAG: hypothetical protein JW891_18085 [Candidatus Lokiarchaeota archaeon]|nr:hypothetical protein [Candidatus Lokiarchaeota archaeon]
MLPRSVLLATLSSPGVAPRERHGTFTGAIRARKSAWVLPPGGRSIGHHPAFFVVSRPSLRTSSFPRRPFALALPDAFSSAFLSC